MCLPPIGQRRIDEACTGFCLNVGTTRVDDHPMKFMGRKRMTVFTIIQMFCLMGLWTFKQYPSTAIFFPSVIGMLMVIRSFLLPKVFTDDELTELGDSTPSKHLDEWAEMH